ncbi:hypothetical protein Ndes2437A_g00275 [Nannochloris sp. 'desiccata']
MLKLRPGEFKKPQTRERRKRVIPGDRSRHKRDRAVTEGSREENDPLSVDENNDHTDKMVRQAAAFDKIRPANAEQNQIWTADKIEFRKRVTKGMQEMYQDQVNTVMDSVLLGHSCCLNGADPSSVFKDPTFRDITVFSAGCNFDLKVPAYKCKRCKDEDGAPLTLTVPPRAVNCGPTAPTHSCLTWITDETLHLFRDLHTWNGLSASGMENTITFLAPEGDGLVDHENRQYTATLKPEKLIDAMQAYCKIEYVSTELDALSTDPSKKCQQA